MPFNLVNNQLATLYSRGMLIERWRTELPLTTHQSLAVWQSTFRLNRANWLFDLKSIFVLFKYSCYWSLPALNQIRRPENHSQSCKIGQIFVIDTVHWTVWSVRESVSDNGALFSLNCFMSGNSPNWNSALARTNKVHCEHQCLSETIWPPRRTGPSLTTIEAQNRIGQMFEQLIKLHIRFDWCTLYSSCFCWETWNTRYTITYSL